MGVSKKSMPPPRCEVCGEEMIQTGPNEWECSTIHLHRPAHRGWIGKISEHVVSQIIFRGKTVESSKIKCDHCDGQIDLSRAVDEAGGKALATAAMNINQLGEWIQKRNSLEKKRESKKVDLYTYKLETEKLLNRYFRNEREWSTTGFHSEIPVVCPNCFVPAGIALVSLTLATPKIEIESLSYEQLYSLGVPKKIMAKAAAELGHPNAEALRRWIENPDLQRAVEVLKETEQRLKALDLPDYLIYNFENELRTLIDKVPKESRRRKQLVVEAVEKIAKDDAGPM